MERIMWLVLGTVALIAALRAGHSQRAMRVTLLLRAQRHTPTPPLTLHLPRPTVTATGGLR